MQSRLLSSIVFCVSSVTICTTAVADPPGQRNILHGFHATWDSSSSWTTTLAPNATITRYETDVGVSASCIVIQGATITQPVEPECWGCYSILSQRVSDISHNFDLDFALGINTPSSDSAGCQAGFYLKPPDNLEWACGAQANATATANSLNGSSATSGDWYFTGFLDCQVEYADPYELFKCGSVNCVSDSLARANSTTSLFVDGDVASVTMEHSLTSTFTIEPDGISQVISERGIWVKYLRGSVLGSGQVSVIGGIYAIRPDGSITRLGGYSSAAYDPTISIDPGTGLKVISINASAPVGILSVPGFTATGKVDLKVEEDVFAGFNGNLNADSANGTSLTCHSDRLTLIASISSMLGDAGYNPRADFDLDGQITPADLDLFNELPCSMDFDCDGAVDLADYFWFMDAYDTQSINADLNADSAVDLVDYFTFLAAYDLPCIQG